MGRKVNRNLQMYEFSWQTLLTIDDNQLKFNTKLTPAKELCQRFDQRINLVAGARFFYKKMKIWRWLDKQGKNWRPFTFYVDLPNILFTYS